MQITRPIVTALATALAPQDAGALRKAAEGFEELFLGMLLKSARAATLGDDLTGSHAVTATTEMLDAQLARDGASHTRFGIADAVERQFAPHAGRKD